MIAGTGYSGPIRECAESIGNRLVAVAGGVLQ
jgi:hypothetical protein